MEKRYNECVGFKIIQLQDEGDKCRVTQTFEDAFHQVHHVVHVSQCTCTCGIWQGYGIPCLDATKYFRKKENKTLKEILDSDAVNDFHKYPYYQELMKRNIELVIIDNLVASSDDVLCSAPEVVPRQAGRPPTKRIRMDKSRFSNPEKSPIICS
jgi:SWIM zinc finger